ncbi:hypothetical protein PVAP13_2KG011128 [Panicum virgatum]|uniref:Uncharacterized protein n=1 Tax=Panicum virgatum TaxID=38727 RepID=A0A8T0W4C4_PANVG|nr:hypothetical protein PVAP13_2KG011128 [Panicum virgatum]
MSELEGEDKLEPLSPFPLHKIIHRFGLGPFNHGLVVYNFRKFLR